MYNFNVVIVNASGHEIDRYEKYTQFFTERLKDGTTLDMVIIPAGTCLIGSLSTEVGTSNDESPQHSVTLKSFLMGRYPVTQSQWEAIANTPKVSRDLDFDPSYFKGTELPVEQVSWYDAVEFCARLSRETKHNYRLPSEVEWEYACRAKTTTPFHFGETITPNLSNYDGRSSYASEFSGIHRQQTTPVGSFGVANAFGLYDIHGNVWEWCADCWHDNYQDAPSDGSAWVTGGNNGLRIMRGGSWNALPVLCRSAFRSSRKPDQKGNGIGFRVVCFTT